MKFKHLFGIKAAEFQIILKLVIQTVCSSIHVTKLIFDVKK